MASKSASVAGRLPRGRGAALAGGVVVGAAAAWAVGRGLGALADSEQQASSAAGSNLPPASSSATVRPNRPPAGAKCAGCGAGNDKPGPWYTIEGERYCADCAADAAGKAKVRLSLPEAPHPVNRTPNYNASPAGQQGEKRPTHGPDAPPTPSTTDGAPVYPTRRVEVEDGSSPVTLDLIDGSTKTLTLGGAKVFKREDGSDVGLGITPVIVEIEGDGPRVVPDSWQITHAASGRQVADVVFHAPEEAYSLGTLLAQFDCWQNGDEAMRRELTTITATIGAYKKAMEGASVSLPINCPESGSIK